MADSTRENNRLRKQVQQLTKELERATLQAADSFPDRARDEYDQLTTRMRDKWDETAEMAKQKWSEVSDYSQAKAEEADRYAHENPWKVAGIAAAAGFLAAILMGNRRRG